MKVLVINGPNLNMLGSREPQLYGNRTYQDLVSYTEECATEMGMQAVCFQSNHEGEIVTAIQKAAGVFDGIVINAAAYTHTSIAILDALKAAGLPAAEVHLTDIAQREPYRRFSYISEYAFVTICGKGFDGYKETLALLKERLTKYV